MVDPICMRGIRDGKYSISIMLQTKSEWRNRQECLIIRYGSPFRKNSTKAGHGRVSTVHDGDKIRQHKIILQVAAVQ